MTKTNEEPMKSSTSKSGTRYSLELKGMSEVDTVVVRCDTLEELEKARKDLWKLLYGCDPT